MYCFYKLVISLGLVALTVLPAAAAPDLISVDIVVGQVSASRTGTLFEATDSDGEARLSIGFERRFQTTRQSGGETISVEFDDGNDKMAVASVGKGGNYLHGGMNSVGGKLIIRPSDGRAESYAFEPSSGTWSTIGKPELRRLYCKGDVTLCAALSECDSPYDLSDRHFMSKDCAVLGNEVVWSERNSRALAGISPSILAPRFLDARYLVLAWQTPASSGFVICLTRAITDSCRAHQFGKLPESPYATYRRNNQIIIATNRGNVLELSDPGIVRILRRDDGQSFQAYSALQYGSSTIVGMYPFGEALSWDHDLRPDSAPNLDRADRSQWEAQSLATYMGRLFVGMWPWGTVWSIDRKTHKWELMTRLFNHPRYKPDAEGPYMLPAPVYNCFNQRVTDLIPLGDSLYALTGSKGCGGNDLSGLVGLDTDQLAEYGVLYRMTSTGNLSVPLALSQGDRLSLTIDRQTMRLLVNGNLVAEAAVDIKDDFCINGYREHSGLMGTARGVRASSISMTGELLCK